MLISSKYRALGEEYDIETVFVVLLRAMVNSGWPLAADEKFIINTEGAAPDDPIRSTRRAAAYAIT